MTGSSVKKNPTIEPARFTCKGILNFFAACLYPATNRSTFLFIVSYVDGSRARKVSNPAAMANGFPDNEIGRASCRERVWFWVVAVAEEEEVFGDVSIRSWCPLTTDAAYLDCVRPR